MPSLTRYINIVSRCGAIWRADHLKGTDLGESQHSYILTLCRDPGISQDALAKRLFINKSNVTRTLNNLEANGYVTRVPSETDRRVTLVYPTEKSYAALPGVREMLRGWNGYVTEGFTEEELATLTSMLARLAERAAEYAKLSDEALDDIARNEANNAKK